MKALNDYINEAVKDKMDPDALIAVYDSLDKGDSVEATYISPSSGETTKTFTVKKGKTKVGKAKVERITLINPDNPKGVKYYLYFRTMVQMAIGDMAASLVKLEKK
jgi:hypothetical protein